MVTTLHQLDHFIAQELKISEIQDDPNALNGLQLDATGGRKSDQIHTLALAVDASEYAIDLAIEKKADLLLVHHGLFWGGNRRLEGHFGRKVRKCFEAGLSVYSVHLPLDVHPALGNNAQIARALNFDVVAPFGFHRGLALGVELTCDVTVQELQERCSSVLGTVRFFGSGSERIHRLGVVSGGGGSCLREAVAKGLDAFLTGETAHYTAIDAEEAGLHLILGGHYGTEVFGVKALGEQLAKAFGLQTFFIDHDTGL